MKKFLALILSIIILASFSINAFAVSICDYSEFTTADSKTPTVTPRYKYLSYISATIGEKPSNNVLCASTYNSMYNGNTYTLICTLQRADGSVAGWVDYKTASQTYNGLGVHGIEKIWYAPAGYAYRTLTTVVVKNASGVVVEKETCYSTTLYK